MRHILELQDERCSISICYFGFKTLLLHTKCVVKVLTHMMRFDACVFVAAMQSIIATVQRNHPHTNQQTREGGRPTAFQDGRSQLSWRYSADGTLNYCNEASILISTSNSRNDLVSPPPS